jgi:hypothetical protein
MKDDFLVGVAWGCAPNTNVLLADRSLPITRS